MPKFAIRALLRENVAQTKLTLRKHIRDLVLTPENGPDGPFYQVSGKWEFLPEDKRVLVLVARDGIELQGGTDNTQVVDFAFCQKG